MDTSDDAKPVLATRARSLRLIVVTAVVGVLAGWIGAAFVRSPAEVAAGREAPPPSVITAPVESRAVGSELVTRGSATALGVVDAVPSQVPAGAARAVITATPARVGDVLHPGDVVVEVSGQPVFFLPGRISAYRSLGPGQSGRDVRQLQTALRAAGLTVADPAGVFGSGTRAAVASLYRRAGYRAQGGGSLPMSSVVYVDSDRATVVRMVARVDQPAEAAKVEIASGDLVVLVDVPAAASAVIEVGAAVRLVAELLDQTATGKVARMLPAAGEAPARALVEPARRLPAGWAGQDVRVELEAPGRSEEVLAVPVAAVSVDGTGRTVVVVREADGSNRRVVVEVGRTGSGQVEVRPSTGSLKVGDQVVVGVR